MRMLTVAVLLFGGTATAAPKSKPTLEHGEVTVSGTADAAAVIKVVKRSSAKLLGCYKKALVIKPGLYGTATVKFTIGADGKVTTADTVGLTTSAGACLATTITKIRFAKAKDAKPVDVTYPLTFDSGATVTGGAFPPLSGIGDMGPELDSPFTGSSAGGLGIGAGRLGGGTGGTGSGYGVGRSASIPTVTLGQLVVKGDLDKAIVRRYLKRVFPKLKWCYEKELLTTKTLKGTVTAGFTIGSDGLVSSSTATGLGNTNVETCMADLIKAIEFPKPVGKMAVTVTVPLTLELPAPGAAPK